MAEPVGDGVRMGRSTMAVHAGSEPAALGRPISGAIVQSTTFESDPLGTGEVLYSRYGNNPNHRRLEEKIARLEGAEACLVAGSGMAAMGAALLSCLDSGDHVVASTALYGGTKAFLDRELSRLGIQTTYVDLAAPDWAEAIRPSSRVILAELPTNPLLRITDPSPLVEVAHGCGATLVTDVTFASPINFRGLEHGVDLVVHSATKYLGGHSDVTAGAVCGSRDLVDRARERARLFGTALDPHAAWLVERGIKTLALRMERHNANGVTVAAWLEQQPEVEHVHYPGLASHPDHQVASRLLDGFGGMLGLELVGGAERTTEFVRALRICTVAPSLGGVETLVSEPRFTSHVKLSAEERAALGIRDGFIRFSLGIEDADDLIVDLREALDAAFGVSGQVRGSREMGAVVGSTGKGEETG
ncbi:MAG: aminotransferase class I/II-fold pyridoxal phosphate-dependent enzyme [Gemmatimonadota bacterium]